MLMSRKIILPVLIMLSLRSFGSDTLVNTANKSLFLPRESTVSYKLGERIIQIKTYQYGTVKDMVYVNLHDDEITAVNGAKKLLEKKGGLLIKIENYRTRNIKFKLDGKSYTIDPNRMFSRKGITQSLLLLGNTSPKAIDEVEKFANFILKLIPQNPYCVVALHNNGNGKFSINTYLPGGPRQKDARALHVNPDQDADDFFLTTDSVLFKQFAAENYNTILQDNENAKKDGSLSVYYGERNMQYVNCETEHGRQEQYDEMIVLAVDKIEKTDMGERPNPDMIVYNFRILPAGGYFSPKDKSEIYFGEKKVGIIKSSVTDSSRVVTGKLEMNRTFALYSNMDVFLFLSANNPPRFEIRIDPTRQGILINPSSTPVNIGIRMTK
jgi:hypothetical protein